MMEKLKKLIGKKPETINPEDIRRKASRAKSNKDVKINQLEGQKVELEKKLNKLAELGDLDRLKAVSQDIKKINKSIKITKLERDKAAAVVEKVNQKESTVETVEFLEQINAWDSELSFDSERISAALGDMQYQEQGYKDIDDALNLMLGLNEEEDDDEVNEIMERALSKAAAKKEAESMLME